MKNIAVGLGDKHHSKHNIHQESITKNVAQRIVGNFVFSDIDPPYPPQHLLPKICSPNVSTVMLLKQRLHLIYPRNADVNFNTSNLIRTGPPPFTLSLSHRYFTPGHHSTTSHAFHSSVHAWVSSQQSLQIFHFTDFCSIFHFDVISSKLFLLSTLYHTDQRVLGICKRSVKL